MIAYVILNYKNYNDTIVCVDSIIKLKHINEYKIIIVDNFSQNESVSTLSSYYANQLNVEIIETNINLGFANGNNFGATYIKSKYNPDFIYFLNNDTELLDSYTEFKIYDTYTKNNFDVYAPQIFDINTNKYGNPIKVPVNKKQVKSHLNRLIFAKKMLKLGTFAHRLAYRLYGFLFRNCNFKEDGLCGAALVFSKNYITNYEDIFVNETFLYDEEYFLQYRKQKDNLVFYLDNNTFIRHLGGASTNKITKNKYEFSVNHKIDSTKKLLNYYICEEKNK